MLFKVYVYLCRPWHNAQSFTRADLTLLLAPDHESVKNACEQFDWFLLDFSMLPNLKNQFERWQEGEYTLYAFWNKVFYEI